MSTREDREGDEWKDTPAREELPPRIPLDEAHACPMCNGKGFVHIVPEPQRKPRRRIRDALGRLIDDAN